MPSRDFRKAKNRVSASKSVETQKRHQSHPLTYIFSLIILIIIVVTFVGYPVVRNFSGQSRLVFGSYNGQEIAYTPGNYFSQEKDIIAQNLQSQKTNASPQILAYQIWRTAFQQTAIHVAIMQAAKQSGMHITDQRIDEQLTKTGPYIVNGKFSADQYNQTSSSQRFQTRNLFREELIDQQYRADVIQGEKISKDATQFLANMASPERKFRYVSFSLSDFPQSQVVAYGKENSKLFRSIKLSRITIKSSAKDADAIHQKLEQNPALFEQIAKNQSRDAFADKGGEMGSRDYYDLKPDFENQSDLDKLFQMSKGSISPVIRASFGWTIYRIDQPAKQPDFTDKQTIKTVRDYMNQYERSKVEDYLVGLGNKFRDDAEKVGFVSASSQANLSVHDTNYFPINYGDSFFFTKMKAADGNDALSNASYKADFLQEIFTLKLASISKPIILNNDVVVVQPQDQRPAPKQTNSLLNAYYPEIVRQFVQADLTNEILSSKNLVDNFQQVFFKNFNFQSSQTAQ